jgi:hypothetical protein
MEGVIIGLNVCGTYPRERWSAANHGFRFEEIPKSNLQEKRASDPKTPQIRLLRHVQSPSPLNGFQKFHGRLFSRRRNTSRGRARRLRAIHAKNRPTILSEFARLMNKLLPLD